MAQRAPDAEDEVQQAMLASMMDKLELQPGTALSVADLQQLGLFYERQAPGSDTCGMNALNNVCQKRIFDVKSLQNAEATVQRAESGGSFAQVFPSHAAPSGFFDVQAVKLAADKVGLEVVDVEPVPDYRKSACFAFVEAARGAPDKAAGSWLLGFLVYDRRPGQMHYYAIRKDERFPGTWVKLDSQLAEPSAAEPRNRRLTEDELWKLYDECRRPFQQWLLRWYPVVYRAGAAQELVRVLAKDEGYRISEACAMDVLKGCGWLVEEAAAHLLRRLPQETVQELLVTFARPSEAEMRVLLEAAQWDISRARPAIDRCLSQRISLSQGVQNNAEGVRQALSLSNCEPAKAATLLSLQLQVGASAERLPELHRALELAGGGVDRAEAVLKLQPKLESMTKSAQLLEKTSWSVADAERVLEVRGKFPNAALRVCLEVLRRNDDDPHAACEMLAEFRSRMQRLVLDSTSGRLPQGEEVEIAESALVTTDWDPTQAFVMAQTLALSVQETRRLLQRVQQNFPVETILAALAGGNAEPRAAASLLLGVQLPKEAGRRPSSKSHGPHREVRAAPEAEEEGSCTTM